MSLIVQCHDGSITLDESMVQQYTILKSLENIETLRLNKFSLSHVHYLASNDVDVEKMEPTCYLQVMELLVYLEADGCALQPWLQQLPLNYHKLLPPHILRYVWESGVNYPCCRNIVPNSTHATTMIKANHLLRVQQLLCLSQLQIEQYSIFIHYIVQYYSEYIHKPKKLIKWVKQHRIIVHTLTLCEWQQCDPSLSELMLANYQWHLFKPHKIITSAITHHWLRMVQYKENDHRKISSFAGILLYASMKELFYDLYFMVDFHTFSGQQFWQYEVASKYVSKEEAHMIEYYFRLHPQSSSTILKSLLYRKPACIIL